MVELHLIHGEFSYQVIAWGLNNELDGTFLQVNLRVTNAQNMFLLNSYDTYKPKHFTKNNEFDGTCIGPTAGDLVPGSRRVEKKKKKKNFEILNKLFKEMNNI